jgi:hypothetical protein
MLSVKGPKHPNASAGKLILPARLRVINLGSERTMKASNISMIFHIIGRKSHPRVKPLI